MIKIKIGRTNFSVWVFITLLSFGLLQSALGPIATFAAASPLRVTEIMYDPNGNGDREFVEIYNGGDISTSLSNMSMVGVDFTYPAGTTLGAGQYGVIVRNLAVFRANNPGARIFGQYVGKLQGGGESVQIISGGAVLSQVDYQYGGAWPTTPKNGGPSLSLIRPNANEALAACWAPSAGAGGTPGAGNNLDTSWSGSHGGGCSNKAYPATTAPVAPPAQAGQPGAAAAQQTPAAIQAQKAVEEAKKQEEQKARVEQQAKAEAVIQEKAKAEIIATNAKKAHESKQILLIAVVGGLVAFSLGLGFIIYKKLHHKHQFKQLVKKHEEGQLHEKAA